MNTINQIDPNSPSDGMDSVLSMYTSPVQEEKLRKASVANQRILAVGDALRHIGNIYHTVRYAPSQQFNSPVQEEQSRYERGKALRDAANARYYSYQQQRAAQEQKARQWEAEQKAKSDQWNATFNYNAMRDAARLAAQRDYQAGQLALGKERNENSKAAAEARQKETERNNRARLGLGYATLNQRKAEFNYKKSQGGGSGRKLPEILRGKKGFYSKTMSNNQLNSFYNQTYQEMKNRGLIDEGRVLAGLPADIFGKKSLSQAAIKQAVDNALMQHPEVGDWLEEEYEFNLDPRSYASAPVQQSSGMNGWIAPGNTWSQRGGYADSDDIDWEEYLE